MYTVGRLARAFGLSRSTLLYYDSIGLLKPSRHAKGEYRRYSEKDAQRLSTICAYREAGVALKDIARILDSPGDSELVSVLEGRLSELREEMEALRHQQHLVTGLLGKPELLESQEVMDRQTWTSLLTSAGFSETDMQRWHKDFERMAPDKHEQFLTFLKIPKNEREAIRSWAAAPHTILNIKQASEQFMDTFFKIYENLERKGPGSAEDTSRAYALCRNLPRTPYILDIGCGSGVAAIELARISGGHVTAVDIHQPFLEETERTAEKGGLSDRITTTKADMAKLPFEKESFDLVWSEGAAYIMGFDSALNDWKRFLRPGGCMVISEAVWLRQDVPKALADFWKEAYPNMQSVEDNLSIIRTVGYSILGHFTLPEQCWETFYNGMETHLMPLEKTCGTHPDGRAILDISFQEIDLYRRYPGYYGYEFFILQK